MSEHYEAQIGAWDPDAGDLPDEIALHIDGCDRCRAQFHARFERWQAPVRTGAPAGLMDRVMPRQAPPAPANRPPWLAASFVLAAAVVVGVVVAPATLLMVASTGGEGMTAEVAEVATKKGVSEPAGDTGAAAASGPAASAPPPPPRKSAPRASGGSAAKTSSGGSSGASRASTATPGTVAVTVVGQSFLAIEVKCPDGSRKRAAFTKGTARAEGVPAGEDCELLFKGGVPAKFQPVRAGQAYTCSFSGSTLICK